MKATKCDKCGSYYTENKNEYREKINGDCVERIALQTSSNVYKYYDLCDDCIAVLMDFLGRW